MVSAVRSTSITACHSWATASGAASATFCHCATIACTSFLFPKTGVFSAEVCRPTMPQ